MYCVWHSKTISHSIMCVFISRTHVMLCLWCLINLWHSENVSTSIKICIYNSPRIRIVCILPLEDFIKRNLFEYKFKHNNCPWFDITCLLVCFVILGTSDLIWLYPIFGYNNYCVYNLCISYFYIKYCKKVV